jgi:hypothetical protein
LQFPSLVEELAKIIGKKLPPTLPRSKTPGPSTAGSPVESYKGVEGRLRLTCRLAKVLNDHEGPQVTQAWLMGLNPELTDRVPIRLLREVDLAVVARRFWAPCVHSSPELSHRA